MVWPVAAQHFKFAEVRFFYGSSAPGHPTPMKPNARMTATRLAGSAKGCHSGTMAWCRNQYHSCMPHKDGWHVGAQMQCGTSAAAFDV